MKPAILFAAVAIGLFRPVLLFVEFNPHVEAGYEAAAHILVGVLLGLAWMHLAAEKSTGYDFKFRPERREWMLWTFWILTAIEVTCAGVSIAVKRGLLAIVCVTAFASLAPITNAADALPWLNAQRAAIGLPPYQQDPALQAKAERDCQTRAARGISGHLGRGLSPGRAEGVGNRGNRDPEGRYFLSCLQASRRYRYAGAAVVVGRRGTYYQLLLR